MVDVGELEAAEFRVPGWEVNGSKPKGSISLQASLGPRSLSRSMNQVLDETGMHYPLWI